MRIVVAGANGFIARALVARLLGEYGEEQPTFEGRSIDKVISVDVAPEDLHNHPRHQQVIGNLVDDVVLNEVFSAPVDILFHLASIPGGMAEQNYELSRQVNVDATIQLLERCAKQEKAPVVIFSSSISVLGAGFTEPVTDETPLRPTMTYAYQKQMGELLIADFSRRGWIDGRSVRFPGIVSRPVQTGQLSAFMSDIITDLAAGKEYTCPIPASCTMWLQSRLNLIENLLHAATLDSDLLPSTRVVTLPALLCSIAELVTAVGQAYGVDAEGLVSYGTNPLLETNFGSYPELHTPAAERAGFFTDGDLQTLVKRALWRCDGE